MHEAENGDIRKSQGFTGKYIRVLATAIQHPWKILLAAIVVAIVSFTAYGLSGLGTQFFPNVDVPGINVTVSSAGDMSIYEKDQVVRKFENRLLDMEAIETLYVRTDGGDQIGYLRLNLVDWHLRPHSDEVLKETQARLEGMAGMDIEVTLDQNGPQSGKDLQIQLSSRFPELLDEAALKIRAVLDNNDKFTSISDTASKPGIEWQLKVNRADAARFGADATLVGSTVQFITNGLKIGEYRPDDVDDELDIRVRYPVESRFIGKFDELRMKTASGMVPISNLLNVPLNPKLTLSGV